MLIFRQLFDPVSSTYSYLLGDSSTGQAALIDPVFEQAARDSALIGELGLKLVLTIDTHVHADHVTGAWLMKRKLGSKIAFSKNSGAAGADIYFTQGDKLAFGTRWLTVRETPGHTSGCCTFVLDDESMAFTGDALLVRGCGRTDFQGGSAATLFGSIHAQIFSLPDACLLYPGHDYRGATVSSVGEERLFNPRLADGISEADFTGYMNNLGLPHPKQMAIAVPANLRCGEPDGDALRPADPDWAPLVYTYAGLFEVQPVWLEEHLRDVELIDVREAEEFNGTLGAIPGAKLIPLGELIARKDEIGTQKPVVTVCRSGARSAQAALLLGKAGFKRVANLAGGMLQWRALRLPVSGRAPQEDASAFIGMYL